MRTKRESVEIARNALRSLQFDIERGYVKFTHKNMSDEGARIIDDTWLDAIIVAKRALEDWLEISNQVGGD